MKTVNLKIGNTFNLRVNKKLVDIETTDKQWKVQFGSHTKEYAQIMYILEQKDEDSIRGLITYMFYTRLIVTDVEFLALYQSILRQYIDKKSQEAAEIAKEEDDKILNEEKALHESHE